MPRLLVVEDDHAVRSTVVTCLELENYKVDAVSSTSDALACLSMRPYDIVLSDIYVDQKTGLDVLAAAKRMNPRCAVILMTGRGSMQTVLQANEGGAFDYLAKPFDMDQLLEAVRRAEAALRQTEEDDGDDVEEELPDGELIGVSPPMVEIYKTIAKVAPTDATVLLEGETGTGKELIARMIHRASRRAAHPFVPVDCGAIAPTLLESELFGAVKGAYTGADRDRVGIFESANGGTVFLDEVGDIDLNFQLKLLRFLQEHEIRPVGSSRTKTVDVRVVAATNRDLRRLISEGKFREDLWFRINVVRIAIPPLRERHADIPLLAHHYLHYFNRKYNQTTKLIDSGLRALQEYTWPGNVRQLRHLMERLSILAPAGRIDEGAVREALQAMENRERPSDTLADAEAEQIRKVLAAAGGNKSRAARILGIERKTLYRKLERLGLH